MLLHTDRRIDEISFQLVRPALSPLAANRKISTLEGQYLEYITVVAQFCAEVIT